MARAGKAIVAWLYAASVIAVPFFTGNHRPDAGEWTQIVLAVLLAAATYLVPLAEGYPWVKTLVATLIAVAQITTTLIIGGIDANDVLVIAFTIMGALGITLAPAVSGNGVKASAGITD